MKQKINENGFTEQEQAQVDEEIEIKKEEELKLTFKTVIEKAKFMMKLQPIRSMILNEKENDAQALIENDIIAAIKMPTSVQKLKAHLEMV